MNIVLEVDKTIMTMIMKLYHHSFGQMPAPIRCGNKVDYSSTINHIKKNAPYIERILRYAQCYRSDSSNELTRFRLRYHQDTTFYQKSSNIKLKKNDVLALSATYQFFSLLEALFNQKFHEQIESVDKRNMVLQSQLFALVINYVPAIATEISK